MSFDTDHCIELKNKCDLIKQIVDIIKPKIIDRIVRSIVDYNTQHISTTAKIYLLMYIEYEVASFCTSQNNTIDQKLYKLLEYCSQHYFEIQLILLADNWNQNIKNVINQNMRWELFFRKQ